MTTANNRTSDHPIDPMFLERWSPRAFTGEPISQADLLSILEAGRWAPSSYNSQPWRFVYARNGTEHWNRLLDLLVPANRGWAEHASALLVLFSKTKMLPPGKDEEVPSPTHSLDAGTASGYLALQANRLGWFLHGMAGFDRDRALTELGVPDGHVAEAAYAIGRRGDPASLPEPLRGREQPNERRPLSELAFEGKFGG